MTQARQAGVLMHITSVPEGNLGPDAYRFVDTLVEMGVSVWQTLPVNQPHDDQSPYQSVSAHAGHSGMISARQPERGAAPHALVACHDVLQGTAGAAGSAGRVRRKVQHCGESHVTEAASRQDKQQFFSKEQ